MNYRLCHYDVMGGRESLSTKGSGRGAWHQ